uniref:Uncharacterized protein n=1 Tax=Romanomermis culicivorax TaxID=13658 RepID=A0A915JSU7_ROMCU
MSTMRELEPKPYGKLITGGRGAVLNQSGARMLLVYHFYAFKRCCCKAPTGTPSTDHSGSYQ